MQSKTVFYIQSSTNGILGAVFVGLAKGASPDDPAVLHDDIHVVGVEHVDIGSDEDLDDIPDDAAEFIAAQSSAAQPQPEA